MSIVSKWKLIIFATKDRRLQKVSRQVITLLCNYHNEKTGQCNPSQLRMANDLGVSDRSIRNGLAELRQLGYIDIIKKGNVGLSTKYSIDFKLQEKFFQATGKMFPNDQEKFFLRTNLRTYLEEDKIKIITGGNSG
tara:strand:+ start:5246 stop:5653 length:408 start_codon:yes stop_codon:yes gene_type:complete